MAVLKSAMSPSGLAPVYLRWVGLVISCICAPGLIHGLSVRNGQFMLSEIRLGSRGDSFYEYLL